MNISVVLTRQIIIMFILMMIGYFFYKKGLITDEGSRDIGKILLYLVIPVIVIKNFMIEQTVETVQTLVFSAVLSSICLIIAMVVSSLLFKKDGISIFGSSFSNAGFLGIPLVQATVGDHAVFFISMMIVLVNFFQWTYGVFQITRDQSVIQAKKILTNPLVLAVILGIIVFSFQIRVPKMVGDVFDIISAINTPLAMMVSGVYLAQTDLLAMLKKKRVYEVSFARLILIPIITILIFKYLPFGSMEVKLAILITAACPVGSNVAIFAKQYQKDHKSAIEQVCMSTLLCLVTLPVVISIASYIL